MSVSMQDPQNGASVMWDSDSFHRHIQSGLFPRIASLIQSVHPSILLAKSLCSVPSPENWLKSYEEASCKIVLEFFFITV